MAHTITQDEAIRLAVTLAVRQHDREQMEGKV